LVGAVPSVFEKDENYQIQNKRRKVNKVLDNLIILSRYLLSLIIDLF